MVCPTRVTFFFVRGNASIEGLDKYLHLFLIIIPDLSALISTPSVNVRVNIAFTVNARPRTTLGMTSFARITRPKTAVYRPRKTSC